MESLRLTDEPATPRLRLQDGSPWWDRFEWLKRVIDSGTWAGLTPAEQNVLIQLYIHADADWFAWPSVERLIAQGGMAERSARRARQALVDRGLVEQVKAGGGRQSGEYRLVRTGWESPVQAAAPRPTPVAPAKPAGAPLPPEQGHPCHQSRSTPATRAGAPLPPEQEEQDQRTEPKNISPNTVTGRPASPSVDPSLFDSAAASELLVERGFNARDARRLVDRHGVEHIRSGITHADFLRARGEIRKSYQAALVNWLKNDYAVDERLAEAQRRADAKAAVEQAAAEQARAKHAEAIARQRAEAAIDAMDPARLAELRAEVTKKMPHPPRLDGHLVRRWVADWLMKQEAQ
jgi:hypothetical protein